MPVPIPSRPPPFLLRSRMAARAGSHDDLDVDCPAVKMEAAGSVASFCQDRITKRPKTVFSKRGPFFPLLPALKLMCLIKIFEPRHVVMKEIKAEIKLGDCVDVLKG